MLDDTKKDKDIKVYYTLNVPKAMKNQKTSTKPYILDPLFIEKLTDMRLMKSIQAQQKKQLKEKKDKDVNLSKYLREIDI